MKLRNTFFMIAALCPSAIHAQTPQNFTSGISIGNNPDTFFSSWQSINGQTGTSIETVQGGLVLYAGRSETSQANFDGGVTICGKPISMVLGADYDPSSNSTVGTFDVWRSSDYWGGQFLPVFSIDTAANTANFDSLDVNISNGSLSIAGSPAVTTASASSVLSGQGFIQTSSLESALNNLGTAPSSVVWTSKFLPRGNVSGSAYFAFGEHTSATGQGATAIGYGASATGHYSSARGQGAQARGESSTSTGSGSVASGQFSIATGAMATASGQTSSAHGIYVTASGGFSSASGMNSTASGEWSTARGSNIKAKSSMETVFGTYNLESNPTNISIWSGLDGLFRIGNGTSGNLSDAVTVLKNGQTRLTNKDWKANITANPSSSTAPLEDPPSSSDSGGNALVVDGHAVLNGKVVISVPQGDISMGIYGN